MLTVAVPDHVDTAHVVDFDLYDDRRYAETGDLHDGLHRLGEKVGRGVFWTPRNGGHWLVDGHDLLFEAARRPDLFSSARQTVPPMPVEPMLIPLSLDPPAHAAFRLPLMRAFAPAAMAALEIEIRRGAGEMHSSEDARRDACFANVFALVDELISARHARRANYLISVLIDTEGDDRNLDPERFPEPMRFDLDRADKTHLTFNLGPHRCAGSHLARLELRIFYEEWFRRMPEVRHAPGSRPVYRGALTLGMHRLPLAWDKPSVARHEHELNRRETG